MSALDNHALAGPYVLDAVTDDERELFEQHLSGCGACATEVAELREAAARLADGTWSTPPPRLRAAVLDQIRHTRQLPPSRGRERRAGIPAWQRRTAFALAAGVIAIAAAGITYAVQQRSVDQERGRVEALQAEQARMQTILTAGDAVVRTGRVKGGGQVTVVMSPSQDAGVVVLAGAPAPDADHSYQLWMIEGSVPVSAGVLQAGHGSAMHMVTGVNNAQLLGVTLEPAGGSTSPTLPVVAQVKMT